MSRSSVVSCFCLFGLVLFEYRGAKDIFLNDAAFTSSENSETNVSTIRKSIKFLRKIFSVWSRLLGMLSWRVYDCIKIVRNMTHATLVKQNKKWYVFLSVFLLNLIHYLHIYKVRLHGFYPAAGCFAFACLSEIEAYDGWARRRNDILIVRRLMLCRTTSDVYDVDREGKDRIIKVMGVLKLVQGKPLMLMP